MRNFYETIQFSQSASILRTQIYASHGLGVGSKRGLYHVIGMISRTDFNHHLLPLLGFFGTGMGTYNYNISKQPLDHQGLFINLGYPAALQILKALISNDDTIHSVPQ